MNMIAAQVFSQHSALSDAPVSDRQGAVFIITENPASADQLAAVCDFLDLRVHFVSVHDELPTLLRMHRPLAVITDVEGAEQDGFHVMKVIAAFNRDLPVMLLTNGDPILMGAADAIQDIWGLRSVILTSAFPPAGQIVSFLFTAGRGAGCMRLVPV